LKSLFGWRAAPRAGEHNFEVIKTADYIVDLGPEGGDEVVATGTPEEVAEIPKSYTGQYLKELLGRRGASGSGDGSAAAKSATKKGASGKATSGKRSPRKKAEAAE